VQPSQKNAYDRAQRAAQMLRGEVIDLFAQAEYAVNEVLIHAAALPEYKALKPAFPHLMGQKLERLRKLMTEVGPLRAHANKVGPLIEKLASFEDLRRFMAHGIVEVALKQSGDPIYVFSMDCAAFDVSKASTLTLMRPDAQSRTARLADTVKALAPELEAITNSTKKPSKRPVKANMRLALSMPFRFHLAIMVDDAHKRMREWLNKTEKRTLAWICDRRPELRDKPLVEVIAALRDEPRAPSRIEPSMQTSDAAQSPDVAVHGLD
jgi:hypothetical protein